MKRSTKARIVPILILFLLAVALMGSLYDYAVRNARIIKENTYQTLSDAADDQIVLLKTKLDDQFIHLEIMAQYAAAQGAVFNDAIRAAMELTAEKFGYIDMGLIDAATGKAQLLAGGGFDARGRDYFPKVLMGQRVIEYVERGLYSGRTIITLMVPVIEQHRVTAILFANYDPAGFTRLLTANAYGGQSYSYVTDGEGEIIIHSGDPNALINEGNVLAFFAEASLSDGITAKEIAANMSEPDTLTFSFSSGDEARYVSCVQMGINDWCLFYLTPASTVEARTAQRIDLVFDLVIKLACIAAVLLALLTIRERETRREISMKEEEYRVAASHSDKIIMRYDLQTKTVSYATGHTPANSVKRTITTGVPESIIEAGLIAEASIPAYLAFYEAMRRGERNGTQVFRMKANSDAFAWFRADYTLLGRSKTPRYAIISFYDVTREREHELVYEKWQQSLRGRAPESYTLCRCGIGRAISVDAWEGDLLRVDSAPDQCRFRGDVQAYVSQYVLAEDAGRFSDFLNPEHLVSSFYNNARMLALDYREQLTGDDDRWMRLTVEMVARADSPEIEAYLLFENINDAKHSELELLRRAETDPLTGLLNRATFEQRMNMLIQASGKKARHALLMLDIDNFKQVNDLYGHDAGDQALVSLADTLRSVTRAGDLVSRLGGDEYVVFLYGISDEASSIAKARQIRARTCKSFSAETQITVSVGIALSPRDGADFETLYKKADCALYYVKTSNKDGEAVYGERMADGPR